MFPWRLSLPVLPATFLLGASLVAWPARGLAAQPAQPADAKAVYVLEIDSDDADDQADALTQAMRARVRATPGLSLAETSQSLGTLVVALKCPTPPDAPCLEKIAEVIRADRFVWGIMAHKGGTVSVDAHLWERGKPEVMASEQYSDTLKDPEADALKKVASHLVGRLVGGGNAASGWVTVRVDGDQSGALSVDGVDKGRLEHGTGKVEVPASGTHTLAVRVPHMRAASQQVTVTAGGATEVHVTLVPDVVDTAMPLPRKSGSSARTVLEWSTLLVGTGFLVAAGVEAILFSTGRTDLAEKSDAVAARYGTPGADGRLHVKDAHGVCQQNGGDPVCAALNDKYDAQAGHRDRGLLFVGIGGVLAATGTVLILTDRPSSRSTKGSVHVTPTLGGISVQGTF